MAHKVNGTIAKICSLALCSAMLVAALPGELSCGRVLAAEGKALDSKAASKKTGFQGYEKVAENAGYNLYYDEETLALIVEDKATGAYMESSVSYDDGKNNDTWLGAMHSPVVMTLINGNDDTKQADLINDVVDKKVSKTSNGFKADLNWTTYGIRMSLEVSLDENGLVVRVPEESIEENNEKFYIGTIVLYPYMGYSYLDEKEGYMLVPDGNGALIYLDDKEGRFPTGFSALIYGSDIGFEDSKVETLLWEKYNTISSSEKVFAPIFGMAHVSEGIAYLGVVEGGEERASIDVMPNGVNVDYNRSYAKFILRRLYTQPTSNNSTTGSIRMVESDRSHADLQVRYIFLSEEQATYSGMASAYRQYLLSNGQLQQGDTTFRTRVDFLGTERQEWVLGTSAVVMTTVEDIYGIYNDLAQMGVTDLLTVYKGWQDGGLYNIPILKYKADSKIGSTKELSELVSDAAGRGIVFYLYDDALRINPDEQNATFNVVKRVNKRRYEQKTYMDVYENLLYLTPMRANTLTNRLAQNMASKGVNNLAVAQLDNNLFTFTYGGNTYSRFDCADMIAGTFQNIDGSMNLVMEQPAEYLWKHADAYLDMPLYTSSFIVEDESIPFLSMVLKGVMPVYAEYVNFEANKQEFLLKMIESGCYPSFYITQADSSDLIYTNSGDVYSSQFQAYRTTIRDYAQELGIFNRKVQGATIESHEILENGVTVVTYSNGVTVYINYGSKAATVDGVSIDSMSYEVRG